MKGDCDYRDQKRSTEDKNKKKNSKKKKFWPPPPQPRKDDNQKAKQESRRTATPTTPTTPTTATTTHMPQNRKQHTWDTLESLRNSTSKLVTSTNTTTTTTTRVLVRLTIIFGCFNEEETTKTRKEGKVLVMSPKSGWKEVRHGQWKRWCCSFLFVVDNCFSLLAGCFDHTIVLFFCFCFCSLCILLCCMFCSVGCGFRRCILCCAKIVWVVTVSLVLWSFLLSCSRLAGLSCCKICFVLFKVCLLVLKRTIFDQPKNDVCFCFLKTLFLTGFSADFRVLLILKIIVDKKQSQ